MGHRNNKEIYLTEAGSLNDVSTVGTKSRSRGAKKRRNEKRKLRDVDRCRREKKAGGKRTRGALDMGGLETQAAQPRLFAARVNEPDEAQILIFSMYMDEY